MRNKDLIRRFYFPYSATALALSTAVLIFSCSKDKPNKTDNKTEVPQAVRKEMQNIVNVSDRSKSSLKGLLGKKFLLSDGVESPTESQIVLSVDALDQVSKVAVEQTSETAINEPNSQRFACSETKAVGEGLLVFSVALKRSAEAPSEEKEVLPILEEASKDLIEISKQDSCQQPFVVVQEVKSVTPPEVPSQGLQLTETSEPDASGETIEGSSAIEPKFDPSKSKNFQEALSEYVLALKADNALSGLGFVSDLDQALQALSKQDLTESDLERACGYVSALRVPIIASLNHQEFGEKAGALLEKTVCK